MKTFVLTVTFFVIKAFQPDFFGDTFNLIAFIAAFVIFALADLYSLGKNRVKSEDSEEPAGEAISTEPGMV